MAAGSNSVWPVCNPLANTGGMIINIDHLGAAEDLFVVNLINIIPGTNSNNSPRGS
jgi:hypothetical protein